MKRLVLVDGNALLHRAYHATPPLSTSKGELVNAVFGFTTMLLKAWNELSPDYLAVAWDMKAPTFRKELFEGYKANRGPADEGLTCQYEKVFKVLKAFNIPEFKLPGFEADDLVGTLAKLAEDKEKAMEIIILTGDRDLMQLIDKRVKILMPRKTISDIGLYGEEEFRAKYGFAPINMIDYKSLAGDQSDNIPGVPGIGEVTATKLIQKYGTLEKILQHLGELPERTKYLLEQGRESAKMSKKLATLETEIPVELNLVKCRVHDFDKDEVRKVFEELEFRSLINKIPGKKLDVRSEKLDKEVGSLKLENLTSTFQPQYPSSNFQHPTSITDLDHQVEPILKKMSEVGIMVDLDFLNRFGKELKEKIASIEKEIYSIVGHQFNLNSPKQLSEILFDEFHLPVIRKTKTGRSTDEETLLQLQESHPAIKLILQYRQLFKLCSTYIEALPRFADSSGRIHSTFNVEGAATGRLSSESPNLQNIPIKGEFGSEIRKAFIAPKGKIILAADYSQIELRVMAHLADDPGLKMAFQEGLDIHALTAAKIFKIPLEEVTKTQRTVGKTMNFATLYGQGPHALSRQLGVDFNTARSYIEEYFEQFPQIKNWMAKILQEAYQQGYVETLWGRRRYFPELASNNRMFKSTGERAAVNHPVQGCLPWETKILTSGGYIPIGELYLAKNRPQFVWDGKHWKLYDVLDRGKAQLARIKFDNGQILKCDVRHKVLVMEEDGYKWKEFSELYPGMKVCFSMPRIHEFSTTPFIYNYISKAHNGTSLIIKGDSEFWYWLGYYIGDGYLHKKWNRAWVYTLTYFFGDHEVEKREQCVKYFLSLGLNPIVRKMVHRPKNKLSTRYDVTIHSQGLGKAFESIGLNTGENAHTKNIPPRIFIENLENRCAFIKGIMDSDGCYGIKKENDPNIHICQRELLQEIQLLLRTMGVVSNIRGPYLYNDKVSYRLDIHRNTLAQVLQQGEVSYYNRYLNRMAPQFLVHEAVLLGGYIQKKQYATRSDYVLFSRWKHGGSSSLYHFQTWLQRNNIDLATPIYHYNEIIEIEKLEEFETTFTLSVPGSHRFDSEGVISKNTAADMIKKAMVEIDKELTDVSHQSSDKKRKKADSLKADSCKLILQIHDELLFECDPESVEATAKMVQEKMEHALELSVPVKVELKVGKNWGEMEPLKI